MNSSPSSTLPHQSIPQSYPSPSTCSPEWVNLCQSYKRKGAWKRFELEPRPYDYEIAHQLRRPLRTTDFHFDRNALPYELRRAVILDETPSLLLCQLRDESVVWIKKNCSDSQTFLSPMTPTTPGFVRKDTWAYLSKEFERNKPLHTKWPSTAFLKRLYESTKFEMVLGGERVQFGYSWVAIVASLCRGHLPWLQLFNAGKKRTLSLSELDGDDSGDEQEYRSDSGVQKFIDPYHPYMPASAMRRTTKSNVFPAEVVTRALAQRRWDSRVLGAVFEIVCKGRRPADVAGERWGEDDSETHVRRIKTLYDYSSRIRKDISIQDPAPESDSE